MKTKLILQICIACLLVVNKMTAQKNRYVIDIQTVKPYFNEKLSNEIKLLGNNVFYFGEEFANTILSIKNTLITQTGVCINRRQLFLFDYKTNKIISDDSLHTNKTSEDISISYEKYAKYCFDTKTSPYEIKENDIAVKVASFDSILYPIIVFNDFPKDRVKPGRYKVIYRVPFDNLGYVEKGFDIIIKNYKEPDYTIYKKVLEEVRNGAFKSLKNHPLVNFIKNNPKNVYYYDACNMAISMGGLLPSIFDSDYKRFSEIANPLKRDFLKDTMFIKYLCKNASHFAINKGVDVFLALINNPKTDIYESNYTKRIKMNNQILRQIADLNPIFSTEYIKKAKNEYKVNPAYLINYAEKKCNLHKKDY